jgi:ketosteroid isomerase-like protein
MEIMMGEARELMNRVTTAVTTGSDVKAAEQCYAADAVAMTPDQGEIRGREQIAEWLRQFVDAFSDLTYEAIQEHEVGNVAIDEGYFNGTHTGALTGPTGESIPATGKQVRVRSCDVATVENGLITQHRFYYDQMEFLGQLGLLPEMPS